MLNNRICFFLILLILFTDAFAQNRLTIKIDSIKSNAGVIRLILFDKNENTIAEISSKIIDKSTTITIDSLLDGTYALKYFHDENSNEKLDANWIGIPTEGIGFSNNAKVMFGPPAFEEMIFEVKKDTIFLLHPTYLIN
ncbi:MAG: DUF2141 domain-containing protein [Bacteroidetes bacterium]|nr:MAG: DUF2141 domain-containing protein [Bacteroidota bacterium]